MNNPGQWLRDAGFALPDDDLLDQLHDQPLDLAHFAEVLYRVLANG